jgi:hypothetical protein
MKKLAVLCLISTFLFVAPPVFAVTNSVVTHFVSQTISILIPFSSLIAVFFLVKGGYEYITSQGKPDSISHAKITIRNAVIGLLIVLSASVLSSLLTTSFTTPANHLTQTPITLTPLTSIAPSNGLTKVLLDAVSGFLLNIVQSSTKPLIDGVIGFLTTTPSLASNSVIFNFWLVILGITNALFVLVIAGIGLHFMSSSTFGFDDLELRQLLPRIGLSFLLANTSIFLADWTLKLCNTLVWALLSTSGGLTNAWILTAIDPMQLPTSSNILITLIFMLLFVILTVVLLLFYITRLITISLAVVLSPLIFLLWSLPRFSDFAEVSIKAFLVLVFTVFIHVVMIQLASAFLTLPGQMGTNSLISLLVGIGLLLTLLKTSSFMMQLMFYTTGKSALQKVGGQIMNVISTKHPHHEYAKPKPYTLSSYMVEKRGIRP